MNDIIIPLIVLASIVGFLAAWVIFDWNMRRKLSQAYEKANAEIKGNIEKLSGLHNEHSQKMIELDEKVSAHDYQLTQRVRPTKPPNFGGGKRGDSR